MFLIKPGFRCWFSVLIFNIITRKPSFYGLIPSWFPPQLSNSLKTCVDYEYEKDINPKNIRLEVSFILYRQPATQRHQASCLTRNYQNIFIINRIIWFLCSIHFRIDWFWNKFIKVFNGVSKSWLQFIKKLR